MPGWSGRVEVVPGTAGSTHVPGELIVRLGRDGRDRDSLLRLLDLDERDERERVSEPINLDGDSFVLLHLRRDTWSTVRFLRGAGYEAQPNHVFFAHGAAETWAGYTPIRANPVVGHPVVGHPVVGHPVVGHPVVGHPVVGHPVVGHVALSGTGCGAEHANVCSWNMHCCDSDPCTCIRPRGQASPIYPHPLFARAYYSETVAVRYELTGVRPSAALPLYPSTDAEPLPVNAAWDGEAIRVAVIDTGWPLTQPGLADAYKGSPVQVSGYPGMDDGKLFGDAVDHPDTELDEYLDPVAGHGMFIAGLLLQYAPGVSVKVVSALSTYGDGDEWTIAQKILELLKGKHPPHIINLSFGTYAPERPHLLACAVRAAIEAKVIVVASAGNDGTSRPSYPAAYPGVVSVGALGPNGPAAFSNWGNWVRACAPGVDVASGFWTFNGKTSGEAGGDRDAYAGWALWSGTSFSAPIVASALAADLQRQRSITAAEPRTSRAVARVIDHPRLHRIPCLGTVVNPAPMVAGL